MWWQHLSFAYIQCNANDCFVLRNYFCFCAAKKILSTSDGRTDGRLVIAIPHFALRASSGNYSILNFTMCPLSFMIIFIRQYYGSRGPIVIVISDW